VLTEFLEQMEGAEIWLDKIVEDKLKEQRRRQEVEERDARKMKKRI
jgi:hypothetical protein